MSSSPPSIFVILLNWNGKEDTLACLKSLENVATPHQVIVVDNGSSDDSTSSFQKNFPNALLIENKANLGFAEGNNIGIRRALSLGAEYLFLLNNDTIVDPLILEGFLKMIKQNPNASILGGRVYLMKDPTRLDHLGGIWNFKRGEFDLIASHALDEEKWNLSLPVDFVSGCSLFAKAEVFWEVGELDPRYFLYWEESDFCFRAKKKGFSTFYCPQAKLWHKVSSSFIGGKPHTSYFWWRNRFLWIEKNVEGSKRAFLFLRLFPKVVKIGKLYLIKRLEYKILQLLKKDKGLLEKQKKLKIYRAILVGIKDYLLRRFGNAPDFIFDSSYTKCKK